VTSGSAHETGAAWKILNSRVPLVSCWSRAGDGHHEVSRRAHARSRTTARRPRCSRTCGPREAMSSPWRASSSPGPEVLLVLTLPKAAQAQATVAGVAGDFTRVERICRGAGRQRPAARERGAWPPTAQPAEVRRPACRSGGERRPGRAPRALRGRVLPAFVGGRVAARCCWDPGSARPGASAPATEPQRGDVLSRGL